MARKFEKPYIRRKLKSGEYVTFDVTLSGLVLGTSDHLNQLPAIMNHFRENNVKMVLDFGAGRRLRNTWPLLREGSFDVYICDYEKLIPQGDPNLVSARGMGLKTLIYPKELLEAQLEFDAILLSYVLNILPDKKCRREVLRACWDKASKGAFLVVASPNYNTNVRGSCTDNDCYDIGWIRWTAKRYKHKAFYSEPTKEYLIDLVSSTGFQYEDEWHQRTAKVLRFRKV